MEIYISAEGRPVKTLYGAVYDALTEKCVASYGVEAYMRSCRKATQLELRKLIREKLKTDPECTLGGGNTCGYTTGADPEVFLEKDGVIVPAWEAVPKRVANIYPDGFALEIAATAGNCFSYVADSVQSGLKLCLQAADGVGAKLVARDVMPVHPELLEKAPAKYTQLGCAPSYNAYGEVPQMPDGRFLPWRTSGSHFHYGNPSLQTLSVEELCGVVRAVEAIRVPLFTAAFGQFEDPQRRTLYGRVGEFRKPKWGLEMRSTGAVVMRHPMLYHFVSTLTRYAIDRVLTLGVGNIPLPIRTMIQRVGNESDVKAAQTIITKYPLYLAILRRAFPLVASNKFGDNMLRLLTSKGGLANELDIANPTCVSKNWRLKDYWPAHSEGDDCNVSNWANIRMRDKWYKVQVAGA